MIAGIEIIDKLTADLPMPILLLVGVLVLAGFYAGRGTTKIKLPSIIGFMALGVVLGPSLLNLVSADVQDKLSFVTELALGFVAFSIGLELNFSSLKRLGGGIISIIFAESFTAFFVVAGAIYLLTRNLPMALIFGALAPASAPAGTVAVIKEFKAKGNLTKALYAVVGFDDGLAIIIFGFAAAIARMILTAETSSETVSIVSALSAPTLEIILSLVVGGLLAVALSILLKTQRSSQDVLVLVCGTIMVTLGLCHVFHLSLILTNMVIGLVLVNTQKGDILRKIGDQLSAVMPLFFILFFALAGANLHVSELPHLGILGVVYIAARSFGLIFGARLGGSMGNVDEKVKKYVGLGILSQAGVAIGLALIVKQEFQGIGRTLADGGTTGDLLGATAITTITATCIFFEIIGPILTKVALEKAGEIPKAGKPVKA
jgi:Kef-type K+ transport system membrane component KefB